MIELNRMMEYSGKISRTSKERQLFKRHANKSLAAEWLIGAAKNCDGGGGNCLVNHIEPQLKIGSHSECRPHHRLATHRTWWVDSLGQRRYDYV